MSDANDLYEDTTREQMAEWINDCVNAKDVPRSNGGPGFTEWEKDFITSVEEQFEMSRRPHPLSGRQLLTLKKIWDKI